MVHLLQRKLVVTFALGLLLSGAAGAVAAHAAGSGVSAAPAAVSLNALDSATIGAAAASTPSVVKISSEIGIGSGVIIDAHGYIVTNYHVLFGTSGETTPASQYTVTLPSGATHTATIAGEDATDDLAVVKIVASGLHALPLDNSGDLRVGQFVLAVGNPLGEVQSVTLGVVSTLGRNIVENGPAAVIFHMIQTSAPINPGNSGGALVDLQGRLVGIPTLAAIDPLLGSEAQGIGFAIPSTRVAFITAQIISKGKVAHSQLPYLGISGLEFVTPRLALREGLNVNSGVQIDAVVPGGPAERAGLQGGDVLVRLGGTALVDEESFADALARLQPGQRVAVTVATLSGQRTVTLNVGELPVTSPGTL